jgi:hypothetical protein
VIAAQEINEKRTPVLIWYGIFIEPLFRLFLSINNFVKPIVLFVLKKLA